MPTVHLSDQPSSSLPRCPMPALTVVDVGELLNLWHGDQLSAGYQHPELAVAVCERLNPATLVLLRNRFYPSLPSTEIDARTLDLLAEGYQRWNARGRKTCG